MNLIVDMTKNHSFRVLPRNFASLGLLIVATSFAGCTFESHPVPFFTPPEPKVNSIDFYPQYFCSGDEITVTWSTENIDKIELLNNAGDLKLSTTSPSGTLRTAPIDRSELPLVARGYVGDEYQDREIDNLVNIDNPTWTNPILSSKENVVPGSRRVIFAYYDDFTLADGTIQQFPVYEVYMSYSGLRWAADNSESIPSFAAQAKVDRIWNITGPTLAFSSYAAGSAVIAEDSDGDIDPDWPASIAWFNGTYSQPKEEFYGWQFGEVKKPPDEWFREEDVYQEATGLVNLLVYCDNP